MTPKESLVHAATVFKMSFAGEKEPPRSTPGRVRAQMCSTEPAWGQAAACHTISPFPSLDCMRTPALISGRMPAEQHRQVVRPLWGCPHQGEFMHWSSGSHTAPWWSESTSWLPEKLQLAAKVKKRTGTRPWSLGNCTSKSGHQG